MPRCISLVLVAAFAAAGPVAARESRSPLTVHRHGAPIQRLRPLASPLDVPVGGGLYFRTPFQVVAAGDRPVIVRIPHYQGPDGAYDSPADLVRAVNGTPCGQACTARSLARWGYEPAQ